MGLSTWVFVERGPGPRFAIVGTAMVSLVASNHIVRGNVAENHLEDIGLLLGSVISMIRITSMNQHCFTQDIQDATVGK